MAIKYDKNLNARIRRTVKNFNAKVRYNKTKTRGKGMLPRTISTQALKDKYSDKSLAELEKQLKLYQSFGQRNALDRSDTSRLSKWEENYFKANLQKTKDFYENEIADLKRIIGDKPEYYLKQHNRLETLIDQRADLERDFNTLTEDQIKGMRGYFNYAERSEIIKEQGFRLYLAQLERTMRALNEYSDKEIETLLNKFNVLSENEFTEMVRLEDTIDDIYRQVYSPKGRGKYELMNDKTKAKEAVERVINEADALIVKYHKSK